MPDLVYVGAACAALLSVAGVWQKMIRPCWKRVDNFLRDWNGEDPRPGFPGRPSIPERIALLEAQVTPNGGNSNKLGDQVLQLKTIVLKHLEEHEQRG